MAGDWIKMRTDLATDPSVIAIAAETGLEEDHVVGKLHRVWSWFDQQSRFGHAHSVTEKWLDRYLGVDGFANAMRNAGWLDVSNDGLSLPHFDRHNGQPAKQRALASNRQAKKRVTLMSRCERDENVTREEKSINTRTPKSPCESQGDFSCFANAWKTWETLQADALTAERLRAQHEQLATWDEADAIQAIRDAIARGGRRLTRPKKPETVSRGKLYVDRQQEAENLRGRVVREARKRGVPEADIESLVHKALAKRGLAVEATT